MKAILVIDDMPKSCWACPLWDKSDYADGCEAVGRKTHDIDHGTDREAWCPLKPFDYKAGALGSVINSEGYTLSTASELLEEIEK